MMDDLKINRAVQEAIRGGIDKAFRVLRRKLKKVQTVDDVIDGIIPEEFSGDERSRLKAQIKKRLRKEEVIK